MKAREPISSYVHRLCVSMENCHLNKYHGNSDYNTPTKQADVLIRNLGDVGPYAELKKEYYDIIKNRKPNWERYTDENEKELLTLEYLEKRIIDAKAKWIYNVSGKSYDYEDESDGEDDNTDTIPMLIQSEDEENYETKEDYVEDPGEDLEEEPVRKRF